MDRRVVLIVLDSLGAGALPDAALYGDEGANTIGHIIESVPDFHLKTMTKLGYGMMDGTDFPDLFKMDVINGAYGKAMEKSNGKDTITGHWEIAGLVTETPFQTFTDTGFPKEFIDEFQKRIGREVIGNYSASGTEIIKELGPEHESTGKPIVYTSADSVFQIAVNVDVIPLEELYEMCRIARELLQGEWLVGRVIARPYVREGNEYTRTSDRKDFSVEPPDKTLLNLISEEGQAVYAIGKISDIFNGSGITTSVHTKSNLDGITQTCKALEIVEKGLIFTNLVDFDAKYGHRRDPRGYAKAIQEFDEYLPSIMEKMRDDDMLIMCADHGNDPTFKGWNHTREYVPVLCYKPGLRGAVNLGVLESFADIGAAAAEYLGVPMPQHGTSFLKKLLDACV